MTNPPEKMDNLPEPAAPATPAIHPSQTKLDPQVAFEQYSAAPDNVNLNRVVQSLRPVISQALVNVGEGGNPLLEEKAKLFTVQAIKKYDPQYGASLHTWVRNQLMQLNRAKREMNSPIKVPERIQLDAYHLKNKEIEFFEKHGRDPDVSELADISHMPVKRIKKIRQQYLKVPSFNDIPEEHFAQYQSDYLDESMGYVFEDSEFIDRKIMEHRFGYGGAEILPNHILAEMLRIRPDALSKRFKRIENRINTTYETIKKTYE